MNSTSNTLRAVRAFFGLRQRELAPWLVLQLGGRGGRGAFRRSRELDAAQRQLAGYQDCQTQVQARHDALPA